MACARWHCAALRGPSPSSARLCRVTGGNSWSAGNAENKAVFITTVDATVPLMCRTFRFTHARRLSASASTPAAPNPASGTQRGSEWLLTQQTATTLCVTWSTLSGNRTRLPEHSLLTSIWVRLVQCLTACAIAMAPASPNELPATRWTHAHASIIHDGTRPTPRVSHDRNPLRSPPLRHNPSSVQLPCLSLQWVMASANAVAPSAPMWSSVQRRRQRNRRSSRHTPTAVDVTTARAHLSCPQNQFH